MTRIILGFLLAGFVYSGCATARHYRQLHQSPISTDPSTTIDSYLAPVRISSAQQLRSRLGDAGWTAGEDVLVLASASTLSRQDLYQVYYSAGYLLYPSRVWLASWCDAAASRTQCETLDAETPDSIVSRYRARQVLLIGHSNPLPNAVVQRVNDAVALATLP